MFFFWKVTRVMYQYRIFYDNANKIAVNITYLFIKVKKKMKNTINAIFLHYFYFNASITRLILFDVNHCSRKQNKI